MSLTALTLLWAFPSRLHTWIAAVLTLNWIATFFVTLSSIRLFEGSLKDETTGIQPFVFRLGGRRLEVDTNLFGAVALGLLSLLALALLLVSTP